MKRTIFFIMVLAVLAIARTAHAVPGTVELTGRLADRDGAPVTGAVALTFTLFATPSGGTPMWSESRPNVAASDAGVVFADLGAITRFTDAAFDGGDRWLEITVNGEVMTPRLQVHSVPYAMRAGDADTVGGLAAEDLGDITAVTPAPAGGLTGGGMAGDVALAVDTTRIQARIADCPAGTAIRAVDANGMPTCDPDDGITGVVNAANSGLNVSVAGTIATLGINDAVLQRRVTGTCNGTAIAAVAANGTVTCNPDVGDIASVRGAVGSGITGGADSGAVLLNIDRSVIQARIGGNCAAGNAISSINANGGVVCQQAMSLPSCTWHQEATTVATDTTVDATCPAGKHVVSGGCDPAGTANVRFTRPFGPPAEGALGSSVSAWNCQFSAGATGHRAFALCCP